MTRCVRATLMRRSNAKRALEGFPSQRSEMQNANPPLYRQ
jgi:hypothetical protein